MWGEQGEELGPTLFGNVLGAKFSETSFSYFKTFFGKFAVVSYHPSDFNIYFNFKEPQFIILASKNPYKMKSAVYLFPSNYFMV